MRPAPHYVLAPVGSTGDMHPFMSLAQALQRMGRPVTLMGPAFHRALVDRAGIPFIGLGRDEDYQRVVGNPALWHPRKGFKVLFGDFRTPLLDACRALMAFQPDAPRVVIGHPFALPAIAMARELGWQARVVGAYLAPSNLRTVHDPLQLGELRMPRWVPGNARRALWRLLDRSLVDPHGATEVNAARAALDLAPLRQSLLPHIQGVPEVSVTLFPDWFGPPQPDWPRPLLMGDFQLFDVDQDAALPDALTRFLDAGPPPLVVTPGTANAHAAALFALAAQAVQQLGRRAVFLTRHREQLPATLPPSILWEAYVPLGRLLPRAAALVHHGGIGTTAEALRAGVPQLVTPFAWDQFDNAARVAALGAGRWIPAARLSRRRLEAALRALAAPAVREHCRQVAARLDNATGPEPLCRAIEATLGVAPG